MSVPSVGGLLQRAHHVESQLGERPGERYHLQLRCWSMRLGGKFLAADDDVLGVVKRSGLVETGVEGLGDQGLAAGMVPARASMDVKEDSLPVCAGCWRTPDMLRL